MKILMGCDPELFVTDAVGKPRSAHGLVPGTKKEPFKVDKGAIQVDGMALEFNIDPATTEDEWVDNIRTVMQKLRDRVPEKYKFAFLPSVRFNARHMSAQPEEAKEMGCEPDFNAYTMQENPKPNAATTMRTAGGHIHIGFTENADVNDPGHIMRCCTLAKHLDLFLGIRSLEWDKDQKRRSLYGTPGSLRVKSYGLEYRPLSCAWLEKEETVRFVYRQVLACINDLKENGALQVYNTKTGSIVDPYESIRQDFESGGQCLLIYGDVFKKKDRNMKGVAKAMELQIGS